MKKVILFLALLIMSVGVVAENIERPHIDAKRGLNIEKVIALGTSAEEDEKIEEGAVNEELQEWQVVRKFSNEIEGEYPVDLKYQGTLPENLSYIIIARPRINLREKPTTESEIVAKAYEGKRYKVLELVENDMGEEWYRIDTPEGEVFVYKKIVLFREFRFAKMEEKIGELEGFIEGSIASGMEVASVNAYIPNPNNEGLMRDTDKYGNVEDQSAVGYYKGTKVFVADRTIVAIEGEVGKRYRIIKQGGEEPYLDISMRRIDKRLVIDSMPRKAIVIDIKNQNLGVYEREEDTWKLISYTYSKTGIESRLGFKTPRGAFIVPTAKNFMIYNDAYGEKEGYAQYAIRFSGGGYIHGTPFNLTEEEELEKYRRIKESLLGSYPGTRKCVRNTLEHAEFLFDWVVGEERREGNFQGIEENVVVIVI
ncbi:hypothetical protein PM10SUCC1_14030 [Propionigenium maris DSM 9537]|uniref:L,D-TPase catalytic domain-containing protein n=1 Tax=Propionigenium maris DSM 9537 TaxID=1123000 RepID=A0A9W6GL69_9FUSO|nr:SH3 domain-containing protein [Propionigenium maris]GLI55889.1 hypothetical protein PM10SUCC1_14030 [Propionigenium maris DSM 9537]